MKSSGKVFLSVTLSTLLLTLITATNNDEKVTVVTYGSTIKLQHIASGYRLHSHDVPYGSGSGQQSVTAFPGAGDGNSYWIVKSAHGMRQKQAGVVVKCGEIIRLQHLDTGKNLHSHEHEAPLTREREVSAYGDLNGRWAEGDSSDDWTLQCVGKQKEWTRFKDVRLVHKDTGNYLTSSVSNKYSEPIPGQLQVSAGSRKNGNTVWRTNEGFYIAPLGKVVS